MSGALIANLRHAARNHETVTIGGGQFGPAELLEAARLLEVAPVLLTTLRSVEPVLADLDAMLRKRHPKLQTIKPLLQVRSAINRETAS